jgi:hypothetical protein
MRPTKNSIDAFYLQLIFVFKYNDSFGIKQVPKVGIRQFFSGIRQGIRQVAATIFRQ